MIEEFDINNLIEEDYQDFINDGGDSESSPKKERKKVQKRGEGKVIELFPTERVELLKYLIASCPGKSRTTVKSYLANRQVTVNGIIKKQFDFMLRPDDKVRINLGSTEQEFRNPMLRIVFEDDHIIIIDKKIWPIINGNRYRAYTNSILYIKRLSEEKRS